MKRNNQPFQPVCAQCKEDMSEDVAVRSQSWYGGMVGVRAKLCSQACAQAWDTENLSHLDAIINDEEVVA